MTTNWESFMLLFLTYRALKVAGNYRPWRREMGFASRLGGAMSSGFSHKQLMLAERPSLWASTAFVITTALGLLLCLSLLASIGFVMTNPFAWVSVTLSKHCFCLSKCARCVSATLSKHCFWTPKINLPQCLSVLASIGFGHPNPSCRLSATLCSCWWSIPKPHSFLTTVSHRKESNNDTRNFIKATWNTRRC